MIRIRLSIVPLLLLLAICLAACEDQNLEISFDYDDTSVEFPIDSTSMTGTVTTDEETVEANLDSVLKANGVDFSQVKELRITGLTLQILTPDSATFDALESFSGYIRTDNLPPIEIGTQAIVPDGVNLLKLDVTSADLLPYLSEQLFYFYGTITTVGPVPAPMTVKADFDFEITGQAL